MALSRFRSLRVLLSTLLALVFAVPAEAQLYQVLPPQKGRRYRSTLPDSANSTSPSSTDPSAVDTQISLEIFTGKEGVGLQAQHWQPSFDHAQISARIRFGIPGDKVSIKEKQYGKLRQIFLVGSLDRNGTLTFPDRFFTTADTGAFEVWLRELKTFGAQGNPTGAPLWGLSKEQFDDLSRQLGLPVESEVANLPLDEALRGLRLPAALAFRLTGSAERVLTANGRRTKPGRLQVQGFAQGTALAMVLSQYGLGFRPSRTPGGKIELLGIAADDGTTWSVGWDTPEGGYPAAIAPKLFDQTTVELKDLKLMDVLDAIAEKTSTPIRIDFAAIEPRGLDLDSVLISVSKGRMTWAGLLTRVTNPSFLAPKIRSDEARKPFVWITTLPKSTAPRTIHIGPRGSRDRDASFPK